MIIMSNVLITNITHICALRYSLVHLSYRFVDLADMVWQHHSNTKWPTTVCRDHSYWHKFHIIICGINQVVCYQSTDGDSSAIVSPSDETFQCSKNTMYSSLQPGSTRLPSESRTSTSSCIESREDCQSSQAVAIDAAACTGNDVKSVSGKVSEGRDSACTTAATSSMSCSLDVVIPSNERYGSDGNSPLKSCSGTGNSLPAGGAFNHDDDCNAVDPTTMNGQMKVTGFNTTKKTDAVT